MPKNYQRSTDRWTIKRKAELLAEIAEGRRAIDDVARTCDFTRDELATMLMLFKRYGVPGLRATRFQMYTKRHAHHVEG